MLLSAWKNWEEILTFKANMEKTSVRDETGCKVIFLFITWVGLIVERRGQSGKQQSG